MIRLKNTIRADRVSMTLHVLSVRPRTRLAFESCFASDDLLNRLVGRSDWSITCFAAKLAQRHFFESVASEVWFQTVGRILTPVKMSLKV